MACLLRGKDRPEKILCARQFQNSIKDSVLSLLDEQVEKLGLRNFYDVQRDAIYGRNGTEFIFRGVHNNTNSVRSVNGATICWIEEAQALTEKSYEVLIPTIRAPGSQFFITYNTDLETDATYQRFNVNPPPNAYVRKVNFDENPFFPQVLRDEMEWCRSTDTDAYMHIWMGEPRVHSDAQIFHGKWEIARFEPPAGVEYMHGVDFGFSVDPSTAVRCYVHDGSLYIYQESYHHKLDIDKTAATFMRDIPGIEKYVTRADSARPETISFMQRHGMPNTVGVEKWTGSVEDGIAVLRAFKKIVIHEQCKHMVQEAKLYSYKIHAQTGDILPEAADKNNHLWDAVRYACAPMIQQSCAGLGYLAFLGEEHKKKLEEAAKNPVIPHRSEQAIDSPVDW
jgi:phage terminase large subunit